MFMTIRPLQTVNHDLRPAVPKPIMPRLAEKAAGELERSLADVCKGARAIEAWFLHNGDPFHAIAPIPFAEQVTDARDALSEKLMLVPTGELVGTFLAAGEALRERLDAARGRDF